MFKPILNKSVIWTCGALFAATLLTVSGVKAEEKVLTPGSRLTLNSEVILTDEDNSITEIPEHQAQPVTSRLLYFLNGRILSAREYEALKDSEGTLNLPEGETFCSMSTTQSYDRFTNVKLRAGTVLSVDSIFTRWGETGAFLSRNGKVFAAMDCRTVVSNHRFGESAKKVWKRTPKDIPLDVLQKALGSNFSIQIKPRKVVEALTSAQ